MVERTERGTLCGEEQAVYDEHGEDNSVLCSRGGFPYGWCTLVPLPRHVATNPSRTMHSYNELLRDGRGARADVTRDAIESKTFP